MDRRLPAARTERRSSGWVWLLIFVILLAAWYWIEWPGAAPAVDIGPPAGQADDVRHIERPGREPRRLDRSDTTRTGEPADPGAGATPSEPPVPLSPRS